MKLRGLMRRLRRWDRRKNDFDINSQQIIRADRSDQQKIALAGLSSPVWPLRGSVGHHEHHLRERERRTRRWYPQGLGGAVAPFSSV